MASKIPPLPEDIFDGLEDDQGQPINSQPQTPPPAPQNPPTKSNHRASWTVAELYAATFPEPRWAVPGIFPVGLSLLTGRPKVGKSWLLLQLAHAVGTGGYFLDKKVDKGHVLFLALEDTPRRLVDRCKKQGIPQDAQIRFFRDWKPFHKGGLAELWTELTAIDYSLVCIDTFTRAFHGVNQKSHVEVSTLLGELQRAASNFNAAFIFSDHTRKPSPEIGNDPIDDVMLSSAKTMSADCVLSLRKERGRIGAILQGLGRDIEEFNLTLRFDKGTCCWQSLGDTIEVEQMAAENEMLKAVENLGKCTAAQVAKEIGKDRHNTAKKLRELCTNGLLTRELTGKEVFYEKA